MKKLNFKKLYKNVSSKNPLLKKGGVGVVVKYLKNFGRKKLAVIFVVGAIILTGSYFVAANYGFFGGGTNTPSVPEDTMTRGLVGSWSFDEGTGQIAYDASENGNNGTLGASTATGSDDPKWGAGKNGGGMEFDGVDDYVDMGNDASLDITDEITISAWVKPNSITGIHHFIWKNFIYQIKTDGTKIRFVYRSAGDTWHGYGIDNAIALEEWRYLTITYTYGNGSSVKIYINGELISGSWYAGDGNSAVDTAGTGNLWIGKGNVDEFNGSIDSVRIYNRALSADEVRYHYNRGGPVGYWNFDEGSGTTAYDLTENNNDGTLKSSALDFDGVNDHVDMGNDTSLKITGDITIEAWVKPDSLAADNRVFANFDYMDNGYAMNIYSDGRFYFGSWQAATEQATRSSVGAVTVGNWNHLVVTRSGTVAKTYRNGVDVTTTSGTHIDPLPSTVNAMIGNDDVGSWPFNGSIDEVRVYNTALSAEEIARHYNGDFSQDPTANLVLLQHFQEGMVCDANDEVGCLTDDSPSGTNDGTLKNFDNLTTWDNGTDGWISEVKKESLRWTNGKYKTAGNFDGGGDNVDMEDDDSLDITGAITVSAWVKLNKTTTMRIVDKEAWWSGYGLWVYNQKFYFSVNENPGDRQYAQSNEVPDINRWYYVAGVLDTVNSEVAFFVDGIKQTKTDTANSINSSGYSVRIGRKSTTNIEFFNGSIDDVRIYDYARSADEIRLDYNAGMATHLGPSGKTCAQDPASCMDYGLVGSWGMDEGAGTTVYDASDNGNDGTLTNGPKWTADSSPLAGGGGSLKFDGSDDYVKVFDSDSLDITDAITMEAWVKTDSYSGSKDILEKNYYMYYIRQTWIGDGVLRIYIKINGTYRGVSYNNPSYMWNNQWHHIVGTWNNGPIRMYIDGILVNASADYSGSIDISNDSLYIGYSKSSEESFNGSIDEVRIYNRALSAEEVRYHYNKGGPVAEWSMDEGSGTVIHDVSGNKHHGTLHE